MSERSTLRPWRIAALAGGGLLAVLIAALLFVTQTAGGRDWLAAMISDLASSEGEAVAIEGIDGLLRGPLTVRTLTIGDEAGEWLRVENARADVSLFAILGGRISASEASAERVTIARFPASGESSTEAGGDGFLSYVAIDAIRLPAVAFPTGKGEPGEVAIAGAIDLDLKRLGGALTLDLESTAGRDDHARLRLEHDPRAQTLSAEIAFKEAAGGLVSGLIGLPERPAMTLDAAVKGPYTALAGALEASLDGREAATARIDSQEDEGTSNITGEAMVHLGRIAPEETRALAPGRSDILFKGRLASDGALAIEIFSIRNAATRIEAAGSVSRSQTLDLRVQVNHTPLGALSDLSGLGAPLSIGNLDGTLALEGPLGKAALSGTLSATRIATDEAAFSDVRLVPDGSTLALDTGAAALTIAGEGTRLDLLGRNAGPFTLAFTGELGDAVTRIDSLKVASEALTVTATGAIEGPRVNGQVSGAITDASFLRDDLSGAMTLEGRIESLYGSRLLKAALRAPSLTVAGRSVDDFALDLDGRSRQGESLALTATLTGSIAGDPLRAEGVLVPEGKASIATLTATLPGSSVNGRGRLVDGEIDDGTLSLAAEDLTTFGALAGTALSGPLNLDARFARGGEAPQVTLEAKGAPAIGGTRLDGLTLSLAPNDSGHTLTARANVEGKRLTIDGALEGDGAETLTLTSLAARIEDERLRLAEPVALIRDGALREAMSARLAFARGGGIDLDVVTGPSFAMTATLRRLPAALLSLAESSLDAGGTIAGTVTVEDDVAFDLAWSEASLAETRAQSLPPLTLTANGRLADERLSLRAAASGEGADLSVTGGIALGEPVALDLKVGGTVALALLQGAVAREGLTLGGAAQIEAAITGEAASPAVAGTLTLQEAALREAGSGVSLVGGAGIVRFDGTQAVLENLRARFARGGNVGASGAIAYGGERVVPDLAIVLDDAHYTDGEMVTTIADGTLSLKPGAENALALGGAITLTETTIIVPERVPPTLEAINVTHTNAPQEVLAQEAILHPPRDETAAPGPAIQLALTLDAPRRLFVRGRGIDAEFGGSLALTGAASAPQARGAFTLRRGRFDIAGKRLTLTRGEVSFRGSLTPHLDFAADTASSGTTATIAIAGPASAPAVTLSSQPSLPSDEILARVLFDRSLDKLSPFQLAQLASAAAEIAGVGSGPSPLERIRARLGLADLDVTTEKDGGTAFSTGQYLSDKVYLGASEGTTPGSRRVTIDLDLTEELKLRGEAGADGTTGAGIAYEYEY